MAKKVEYKGLTHCAKTGDIVHPIMHIAKHLEGRGIFYKWGEDDFGEATEAQIRSRLESQARLAKPSLLAEGAKIDKTRGWQEVCITLASFEIILRKSFPGTKDPRQGAVFCLPDPDHVLADEEITKLWDIPYDRWFSYVQNQANNPHPKIVKKAGSKKRKKKVYHHFKNSIGMYYALKREVENLKFEINVNAQLADPKKMPRDLQDTSLVQNATSRLLAKVGEINKRAMIVKAEASRKS